MGLPHLSHYYYAAILDQTKHWLHANQDKQWIKLEQEFCTAVSVGGLLWFAWLHLPIPKCSYLLQREYQSGNASLSPSQLFH